MVWSLRRISVWHTEALCHVYVASCPHVATLAAFRKSLTLVVVWALLDGGVGRSETLPYAAGLIHGNMIELFRDEKSAAAVLKGKGLHQLGLLLIFDFIVILYAQVEAVHALVLLVCFDTGDKLPSAEALSLTALKYGSSFPVIVFIILIEL